MRLIRLLYLLGWALGSSLMFCCAHTRHQANENQDSVVLSSKMISLDSLRIVTREHYRWLKIIHEGDSVNPLVSLPQGPVKSTPRLDSLHLLKVEVDSMRQKYNEMRLKYEDGILKVANSYRSRMFRAKNVESALNDIDQQVRPELHENDKELIKSLRLYAQHNEEFKNLITQLQEEESRKPKVQGIVTLAEADKVRDQLLSKIKNTAYYKEVKGKPYEVFYLSERYDEAIRLVEQVHQRRGSVVDFSLLLRVL